MPKKRSLNPNIPPDMLMTSVILSRADHQRGRHAAITRGWSFTELIRVALREWLGSNEPRARKVRPLAQIERDLKKGASR